MYKIQYAPLFLLLSIFTSYGSAQAQNADDALRFSFLSPQGTARSMGFGSALGSIGADFTSASVNPAGLGLYRSSEYMITPALRFGNTTGLYLNEEREEGRVAFNFTNIGLVFTRAAHGQRYEKNNWKAVSFAVGINRVADFNRTYTYGGLMKGIGNEHSSFSEVFVNDAQNYPEDIGQNGTLAYLGYQSYLVNEDSLGFFTLANWQTGLDQLRYVRERGGISEIVFSVGGNYQEKLMLGLTVGVPSIRYSRESYFEETDATDDPNNFFSSFRYRESLTTTGLGVNLKIGAIYRASDYIRFGVAFHTPTWYSLSDRFDESLTANTEGYMGTNHAYNDPLLFDYHLVTPWRAVFSASAFLGRYGFISADYEYVGYKSMRFRFPGDYAAIQNDRNEDIKDRFKAASNFRIGAEARLDHFYLRAGFGYYGSPVAESDFNQNRTDLSLGFGFRPHRFFADIAYVHSRYNQWEMPYSLPQPVITPIARLENRMNVLAVTIGWKM